MKADAKAQWEADAARLVEDAKALRRHVETDASRPADRIVRVPCEVGCIWYSTIRNLVKEARHRGYDVKLEEGSGWLSRPMWLTGPKIAIDAIGAVVQKLDRDE